MNFNIPKAAIAAFALLAGTAFAQPKPPAMPAPDLHNANVVHNPSGHIAGYVAEHAVFNSAAACNKGIRNLMKGRENVTGRCTSQATGELTAECYLARDGHFGPTKVACIKPE